MAVVPNNWEGVSAHAARVGAKFPALVAAQWALESGFGKHFSGKWNVFGLKSAGAPATVSSTKEFYDGQWVEIKAGFIDFPSLAACIEYLVSHWYQDWRHHKGVNNASNRDDAARMLQSEGYATDPTYASKLIRLMNQYAPIEKEKPMTSIRLTNAAKYFTEQSHQIAAWNWLQEQLSAKQIDEFATMYRAGPPPKPPLAPKPANPLIVPYFSQRDNLSGQGHRECFSSSCAMVAAFYGKVKGDDEYNLIRARFGDTTSTTAQARALEFLGLKPTFRQNVTRQELQAEINAGRPLAVGWLHQGKFTKPSGGGHWSVAVGFTDTSAIMHDPFGLCDLVNGGYKSASGGQYAHYAYQYWFPRWSVQGSADGWAMFIRP
jgi:hypothetical protein